MDSAPCFVIAPAAGCEDMYVDVIEPGGPAGDSGTDLCFAEDALVHSTHAMDGRPTIINLGVRVRCRYRNEFVPYQIVPRSSIGKTPFTLANSIGIIDSGYQGPLKVAIHNHSGSSLRIERGSSAFQLIRPDLEPATVCVVSADNPAFTDVTKRGEGGFGSTGAAGSAAAE